MALTCLPNFYLNGAGGCSACEAKLCTTCSNSTTNCGTCFDKYYPKAGTCELCTSKKNVVTCNSATGRAIKCTRYNYIDGLGGCHTCKILYCDLC